MLPAVVSIANPISGSSALLEQYTYHEIKGSCRVVGLCRGWRDNFLILRASELRLVQPVVKPAPVEQFLMPALFHDTTMVHDQDGVRVLDGG